MQTKFARTLLLAGEMTLNKMNPRNINLRLGFRMQKQVLIPVTVNRKANSTLMVQFCRMESFELIAYTVELVSSHYSVSFALLFSYFKGPFNIKGIQKYYRVFDNT